MKTNLNQIKSNLFAPIYLNNDNYTSHTLSRTARLNKWHWQLAL